MNFFVYIWACMGNFDTVDFKILTFAYKNRLSWILPTLKKEAFIKVQKELHVIGVCELLTGRQ